MYASTCATSESRSSRNSPMRCAQPPGELFRRRAQRKVGLRADQVHDALGLREVHSAVEKRALGKFARLGRARPGGQQSFQHATRNRMPP